MPPMVKYLAPSALALGFRKQKPHGWGLSAESQNRTGDTAIFSRVLYQLSYLGLEIAILPASKLVVKHHGQECMIGRNVQPLLQSFTGSSNLTAYLSKATMGTTWKKSSLHISHLIIGLTGNIGSGKSSVRKMLEHLGAMGIDADRVGQDMLKKESPAFPHCAGATFGDEMSLTSQGEIDRKKLGEYCI